MQQKQNVLSKLETVIENSGKVRVENEQLASELAELKERFNQLAVQNDLVCQRRKFLIKVSFCNLIF